MTQIDGSTEPAATRQRAQIVRADEGARFGGAPWLFKATGDATQGRFDFMVGDVGLYTGPPLHVHVDQYDTFYVLDGVLTVQVDDEIDELGPGDFVTVPPGVAHTFDNVHPDQPRVRTVNMMSPGGLNELFAAVADPAIDDAGRVRLRERFGNNVGVPLRVTLGLAGE